MNRKSIYLFDIERSKITNIKFVILQHKHDKKAVHKHTSMYMYAKHKHWKESLKIFNEKLHEFHILPITGQTGTRNIKYQACIIRELSVKT